MLSHYSDKVVTEVKDVPVEKLNSFMDGMKPRGLWLSVDGEDDWVQWCLGEKFRLDRLAVRNVVTLAEDADIIWIIDKQEFMEFDEEYGMFLGTPQTRVIDWIRVAEDYDGIIIAPYLWLFRLHPDYFWYYTWDCASGCIWNSRAIKSIEHDPDWVVPETCDDDAAGVVSLGA